MDGDNVKSITVTLNEFCVNDSEFTVMVTFERRLSNGKCGLFSTNETENITPGESMVFSPSDGTSSMSDTDYCYVAKLSADDIIVYSE